MPRSVLVIGLLYDRPEDFPDAEGPDDRFAEFEPESTIVAMEEAIKRLGYRPVRLGSPFRLLQEHPHVDLIWNIAEGYGTRNREAWAPAMCEMRDIPYTGSDALTLSLTLDKALTKQIARSLGIPTAGWQIQSFDGRIEPNVLGYPVFAKPRYEGSAKGIGIGSLIGDPAGYERQIRYLKNMYRQDVLVETFLEGAEYTCALSGTPLKALPVMQRALHHTTHIGLHALAADGTDTESYHLHTLGTELEKQLQQWSTLLSNFLEVKDYARIDFKLDSGGRPFLLEINPLPTFAVDNTYAILAELESRRYDEYLAGIIAPAIERVMVSREKIGNGQQGIQR